ncbi:hypothetical protein KKC59_00835 [bacterium]|nr:hypothetical protein [bacterium]
MNEYKKYAVIDIGSNSTHMDIFQVDDNNSISHINYKTTVNKLGRFISKKHIPDKNLLELIDILKDYISYANNQKIDGIFLFATSIFREIEQKEQIIEKIREHINQNIEILTEEDEALFAFKGAANVYDLNNKNSLVIDIGGGSTEIIVSNGYTVQFSKSFPVGLAKLKKKYDISQEFDFDTKYHLEDECNQLIDNILHQIKADHIDLVIGTSSLFKILGFYLYEEAQKLMDLKDKTISSAEFTNIINLLIAGEDVNIDDDRKDIALIGSIFMRIFLEKIGCNSVLIAPCSIREGYLRSKN